MQINSIYVEMHIGRSIDELTQGLYLRDGLIDDIFYFFTLFYIPDLYDKNITLYLNQKINDITILK